MIELNKIYNENCLVTMSKMKNDFIDMVITSPPYDDLRDYKGYSFEFEKIANELYRILKQGGVLVWVVGDATINGSETGTSFKQALYFKDIGFNIHDTMIYEKNSPAYPANEKSNRYSQIFEYMFILSKGKPKTINLLKDKKNKYGGQSTFSNVSVRKKNGELIEKDKYIISDYGYRYNIWRYNNGAGFSTNDEIAFQHPAIFPEKLVEYHILSWSNENDIVYDCFGGSGTTAKMAHKWKRNWILSELSKEYVTIANKRLKHYLSINTIF